MTVKVFVFLNLLLLSLGFANKSFAQDSEFNLDEFEQDISGGVKKEKAQDAKVQAQADEEDDGDVERIEVTGSHIKRIDVEGPSPVQVIDREALERSGYNSVSDVLRDTTANSFGSTREASGSNAAGVATVSLRGLGADKTLVLLNGKRLPSDAVTGSIDLNLIPMAAVKRVEILKDGASATYGSDALGGVVNIITYKDFNGSQITLNKSRPTINSAGETFDVSLVTGSATSKSSMVTVVNFRENGDIYSSERFWTENGLSPNSNPASFYDYGDNTAKRDPDCPADRQRSDGFCNYNYAVHSTELPALRQISAMTLFEYETDFDMTLFGRVSMSRKFTQWQYAPAVLQMDLTDAQMDSINPGNYSGSGGAFLLYRTEELGNRVSEIETNAIGYQLGLKGTLKSDFDWEFTFDRNRVKRFDLGVSGYGLKSVVNKRITDGDFNPFNEWNASSNSLDAARFEPWEESISTSEMYEYKLSGELMDMPNGAGAIGGAVGIQYVRAQFSDILDASSRSGDVFGSAGSNGGGKRNTQSAYFEIAAPLLKGLEVQVAGRYDKFSDFGETSNPKVGMRWQVSNKLMVRSSWGTGFKAPSMNDLYAAYSDGNPTFVDAVACDALGGDYCKPKQYSVSSGGNPGLKEETSSSYNIGVVYQHSKKTSFGFDYWVTELDNLIGISYGAMTIAELNGATLSNYGIEMTRNADQSIKKIKAPLQNLSKQEVSGIDIEARHAMDTKAGSFNFGVQHGLMLDYSQESFPGTGFNNILGTNGAPKWRNVITLGYSPAKIENLNIALSANTISKHGKAVASEGDIDRYTQTNLSVVYQLAKLNGEFSLGWQNIFNRSMPLDDSNTNNQLDTGLYNPRGPVVTVGYKQRF